MSGPDALVRSTLRGRILSGLRWATVTSVLQRLVRDLGIFERVRFLQWQETVNEALAAMDVLVSSSNQPEAFGLVIAEGMLAGKPVIATDGGGVPDLVQDGETGLLVPMGSAERMHRAIVRLIQDAPLRAKLVENGKRHIETNFTPRANARKVMEVYEALLTGFF